ncbi:leucine-rich repeat containing protein, putative [Ricinus communis]|uniref:Leucine-rich repeat containing protein, putative n=1 Tax=Ricinus communis TaxID=3988 RepID=B9SGW1_RICCO|nr:leucine-rich repeat containing protein, putative [Ricinus communis]
MKANPHLRSLLRLPRSQEYLRKSQWTYFGDWHKLIRVLDLEGAVMSILPKETGQLIHLRHLGLRHTGLQRFSFSINNLKNLQTLDLRDTRISRLPNDIWKMQNLRHLYLHRTAITGRPLDHVSAANLRTLSTVSIYGIFVLQAEELSSTLVKLSSLETLQLKGTDPILEPILSLLFKQPHISKLHLSGAMEKLPDPGHIQPNLTKLTLEISQLAQEPFLTLERLPSLKMLRLLSSSFCGKEMACTSEWKISGAMPSLRRLIIHECEELCMLPEGLQYLSTFREVVIEGMPHEFEARIQRDNGDDWYKIHHTFNWKNQYQMTAGENILHTWVKAELTPVEQRLQALALAHN